MNNSAEKNSNNTKVNQNVIPKTKINSGAPDVPRTTVNSRISSNKGEDFDTNSYDIGKTIDGKYTIISKMNTNSGEADIFVCVDNSGKQYCLKHYLRADQRLIEVHEKLQHLQAPFVANMIDWGDWGDGKIYEIWPLYNESLAGKKFTEQSIKRYISQMNEAIHAVHVNNIVHQDIKPANFMLDEDDNIKLIDFGISAVRDEDGRTHVTKIGLTTEYAAPEVLLADFFWPASDYYSLGVTIYELLVGFTPYCRYDKNMIQRKLDDMRNTNIPGINAFSKVTQDLLVGLLQYDYKLRWSFKEVCNWLNNDYIPPAHREGSPFKFNGTIYYLPNQWSELILDMAYHWNLGQDLFDSDGRSELLKKTLLSIEGADHNLYMICNRPKPKDEDPSLNYFRKLYQLCPELKLFTWRQYQYRDKIDLGEAILKTIWSKDFDAVTTSVSLSASTTARSVFESRRSDKSNRDGKSMLPPSYAELMFWVRNRVISQYLRYIGDEDLSETISDLEAVADKDIAACYTIAYTLSKSTKLRLLSGEFKDKEAFISFVKCKIEESEQANDVSIFLNFCRTEISDGATINPGFKAWATSLGMGDALKFLTNSSFAENAMV